MTAIQGITPSQVPQHVVVIMDGNGRWAEQQNKDRSYGHNHAIFSVQEVINASLKLDVKHLTLYTFSKENWSRPAEEVNNILTLIAHATAEYTSSLMRDNICVRYLGDFGSFPTAIQEAMRSVEEATAQNTGLQAYFAVSYSGRWEIARAARKIAQDTIDKRISVEEIDEKCLQSYLNYPDTPDPELLIRTGGEMRISNFLLWQLAYTELYVTKVLWPDFRKKHFYNAIRSYQRRNRRFGEVTKSI